MTTINENIIESLMIENLKNQNYSYILGQDLTKEGFNQLRSTLTEPLLLPILQNVISHLNMNIPEICLNDALSQIKRVRSQNLLASNEAFHHMLTDGIKVSYQRDGTVKWSQNIGHDLTQMISKF
jgi:type I restriction enzyme R subunit